MRIVLKQWLTDSDSCDKVYNVAKRFQQITSQAAVAQSVERRIGSAEVTGPIPVSSFFLLSKMICCPLAAYSKHIISILLRLEALFYSL